jgi:serine protease Do
MQIRPGSSGSPVFDLGGKLVAVVKGRYRGAESVGFLIPYASLMKFLGDQPK